GGGGGWGRKMISSERLGGVDCACFDGALDLLPLPVGEGFLFAFCFPLPPPVIFPLMPKQSFPEWIVPMAATLTQERFTDPEWSFERKFDGIRLLAYKKGKQVELFSRNRLPQNLPAISQAIAKLPHRELILDGEITWHAPFSYHIFDIMWIDGHETMSLPLEERRALLKQLPLIAPLR